jgi:subtilisin family serine protease
MIVSYRLRPPSTYAHRNLVIVASLIRAVNDGADVLNLSVGGPDGWTGGASAVVASRIADTGKIVVMSAGNDVRILCDAPVDFYSPS